MNQKELFEQAMKRPKDFHNLSEEEHWRIDRELGILDWDGSCPHKDGNYTGPCSECKVKYWKTHDLREA